MMQLKILTGLARGHRVMLLCRFPYRSIIACQCGKGRKLGSTVPHRHPWMMLRLVVWKIDDIVVISHNSQL